MEGKAEVGAIAPLPQRKTALKRLAKFQIVNSEGSHRKKNKNIDRRNQ